VLIMRLEVPHRDIGTVRGRPATWQARTVFDCLRLLPAADGDELLDRALQQRWATPEELLAFAQANVGRHGVPRVRRLLGQARGGERSVAERRLTSLLTKNGITGWVANQVIMDSAGVIGIGDVVFPERRLVIEVDGLAFHVTPERFQRDRVRQNRLIAAGWTVLRFTWRDLSQHPRQVTSTIERLLRTGG